LSKGKKELNYVQASLRYLSPVFSSGGLFLLLLASRILSAMNHNFFGLRGKQVSRQNRNLPNYAHMSELKNILKHEERAVMPSHDNSLLSLDPKKNFVNLFPNTLMIAQ
jgi:hypothetical protein